MKQQFTTNLNCGNCVRAVTNFLDDVPGITAWAVDTDNPDKVLTVEGTATPEDIIEAVEDAGFDISVRKS